MTMMQSLVTALYPMYLYEAIESSSKKRGELFMTVIRQILMTTASISVKSRQLLKLERIKLGANLVRAVYCRCMPRYRQDSRM